MKLLRSIFIFCLIVWVLGELLTRLLVPIDLSKHTPDRTEDHPYLRTDWVPGMERSYIIEGIAGQTGSMKFKINEFGFRSESMKTAAKPVGTRRIFFLGGSTTEEIYLPEEKTFPWLVERKLSGARPGRKFECINGGVSGYLAADVLALLIYKVIYYEPDLVIVVLGVNDLIYGTHPQYDPIHRLNFRKRIFSPYSKEDLSELIGKIFKRSQFLTLIKWRILNRIFPPEAEKYKTSLEQYEAFRQGRKKHPFTPISESKSLDDFKKYLEEIIFVAQGHGVRLIFMTEPSVYQPNLPPEIDEKLWMGWRGAGSHLTVNLSPEFLFREMNRFNQTTRELSLKYGVELIDLEKSIPKDLDHFYDDVHLTPAGAQKAAEVITAYLSQNLKSQPSATFSVS